MERLNLIKNLTGFSLFSLIAFFIFGKVWLLGISGILLILIIFETKLTYLVAVVLLKIEHFLGNIISKTLLSLVFFIVVSPLGLLFRIFNRETYLFFKDRKRDSFFKDINYHYKKEDFEKLW
ncbi:MAG: hypothetical protein ACUVUG_00130 [Candidatus Aminicenantia bacterium]